MTGGAAPPGADPGPVGATQPVPVTVRVRVLASGAGLPLPARASASAAGLDLRAAVPAEAPVVIRPGARRLIGTGLAIALPPGHEAQIRPRSGIALEHGVTVLNAPGTIDADYRGEVAVLLVNLGESPFRVARGDRIAQLVVAPVTAVAVEAVAVLEGTERGVGGFGSTHRA